MTSGKLPKPSGWSVLNALKASSNPEQFFARCQLQGDPFCVELPGVGPIYMSGSPDAAKQLFSARPEVFEPVSPNPIEPMLGPGSLILLGRERHKRERKLLTPPFMGERMRAYGDWISHITMDEIRKLEVGQTVDAVVLTQQITLKVIVRAIFGVRNELRQAAYSDAITAFTEGYSPALLVLPFLRRDLGGMSPWKKFRQAAERFDALLEEDLQDRLNNPELLGEDILSLLIGLRYDDGSSMSSQDMKDELRTMLVAGHETTATGLAWCLYYLHRDPEKLLAPLLGELNEVGRAPADYQKASYLGAVCQEGLRRHPVVPIVLRRTLVPFEFCGYEIEPGTALGIAMTLLHTSGDTFDTPLEFNPRQFLEKKYTPFQYAPYGGGARRCLGAAFASYEMRIVLGTLLQSLRFESAQTVPPLPITRSITMAPDREILLRVAKKLPLN